MPLGRLLSFFGLFGFPGFEFFEGAGVVGDDTVADLKDSVGETADEFAVVADGGVLPEIDRKFKCIFWKGFTWEFCKHSLRPQRGRVR